MECLTSFWCSEQECVVDSFYVTFLAFYATFSAVTACILSSLSSQLESGLMFHATYHISHLENPLCKADIC